MRTTKLKKDESKYKACTPSFFTAEDEDTDPIEGVDEKMDWSKFGEYDPGFRMFAFKEDTAGQFGRYDLNKGYH